MKTKRVLLGVTASIAAYKACDIAGSLRKAGYEVIPVLTKDACHFVTPLSLQTIARSPVVLHDDFFSPSAKTMPGHVRLADECDLILIAPATADVIAKLACGIADDVLTCTVLSTKAPVLIAPAMNDKMYLNPITQENIARLKKHGFLFIPPIEGDLACGTRAIGHIADCDTIVKAVKGRLSK